MEEKFKKFLRRHRVIRKFKKNMGITWDKLMKGNGYSYMYLAFPWYKTPEGHLFWSRLNKLWIKKLDQN